jgi:hypothetical protein
MLRSGGGVIAGGHDQFAPLQALHRSLDGAFGETGGFGERAQARADRAPILADSLAVQKKVNEIRAGVLIVADEVAHEDIDHVTVDRDGFTATAASYWFSANG